MDVMFKWERVYESKGIEGLSGRKPTGRPPLTEGKGREMIPNPIRNDPQA